MTTLRDRIIALLSDGEPRTSSTLADESHNGKATNAEWLEVLQICERLVEQRQLKRAGKNERGQGLYKKA